MAVRLLFFRRWPWSHPNPLEDRTTICSSLRLDRRVQPQNVKAQSEGTAVTRRMATSIIKLDQKQGANKNSHDLLNNNYFEPKRTGRRLRRRPWGAAMPGAALGVKTDFV